MPWWGERGTGVSFFPIFTLADRLAPVAAALVLQMLTEGASLSAIVARYPQYAILKDKLERPQGSLEAVFESIRSGFADAEVDTQDGVRLAWPDRWVHVRASGTEPIVRVIAEAPTEAEARDLISRCRAPLEALAAQA